MIHQLQYSVIVVLSLNMGHKRYLSQRVSGLKPEQVQLVNLFPLLKVRQATQNHGVQQIPVGDYNRAGRCGGENRARLPWPVGQQLILVSGAQNPSWASNTKASRKANQEINPGLLVFLVVSGEVIVTDQGAHLRHVFLTLR